MSITCIYIQHTHRLKADMCAYISRNIYVDVLVCVAGKLSACLPIAQTELAYKWSTTNCHSLSILTYCLSTCRCCMPIYILYMCVYTRECVCVL